MRRNPALRIRALLFSAYLSELQIVKGHAHQGCSILVSGMTAPVVFPCDVKSGDANEDLARFQRGAWRHSRCHLQVLEKHEWHSGGQGVL